MEEQSKVSNLKKAIIYIGGLEAHNEHQKERESYNHLNVQHADLQYFQLSALPQVALREKSGPK